MHHYLTLTAEISSNPFMMGRLNALLTTTTLPPIIPFSREDMSLFTILTTPNWVCYKILFRKQKTSKNMRVWTISQKCHQNTSKFVSLSNIVFTDYILINSYGTASNTWSSKIQPKIFQNESFDVWCKLNAFRFNHPLTWRLASNRK